MFTVSINFKDSNLNNNSRLFTDIAMRNLLTESLDNREKLVLHNPIRKHT